VPPVAPERPHLVESPFGSRSDPYYWLRDDARTDPDVLAHLAAENAYTDAVLAPVAALREQLYAEIVARLKQDDASVPARHNGWWYWTRFETGREHPVYLRRRDEPGACDCVLLDVNELAEGHEFFEVSALEVSPDNRLLAWAEDGVGRRQYTIRIRDLASGVLLPDCIENTEPDLAWANDSATLLYIEKDPQTLLGQRVRAHRLGTPVSADRLLYEEQDDSYYLGVSRSKSERHLYISCDSTLSTEYRWADADDPALEFRVAIPREREHEYDLEELDGRFVIRSNERAPNFRIVEAPIALAHDRASWRELVAHRTDVLIEDFEPFVDFLALAERSGGLARIRVRSWDGTRDLPIAAEDPACSMGFGDNEEIDAPALRYVYASPTTPRTTFDLEFASGERTLLKRDPVLGDFQPEHYATEFLFVPARDGRARIPVTLLYRRATPLDGTAPLYQYAYGAYGISSEPGFRLTPLALVDRGFVYAIAHVRGGQELGRAWYEDGRLAAKRNSFNDFVDVTRALVERRYADPQRCFAAGGSAGGLLMGVIANQAPELYLGIVAHVPFVDIVTSMLDETIPLTTNEYDEWGDPARDRAAWATMLEYSPYDNVRAQAYPALLATTGLWDSQVQYWEPAKWVARLRRLKIDDRPVLLRANLEAGHGGKSGRFQRYHEIAEEYAFVLGLSGAVSFPSSQNS
jgi:oligopeptidase B